MVTFFIACQPDTKKPIGGVKQLHRLAECIVELGYQCYLVQDDPNFHPGWFRSDVKTVAGRDFNLGRDIDPRNTVLILPETYVEVLERYPTQILKIIFNQNMGYTFTGSKGLLRPEAVHQLYCRSDVRAIWCVSDYDFAALSTWLHGAKPVFRIVNAIDSEYFSYEDQKDKLIAYMPRKSREHSVVVKHLVEKQILPADWRITPLNDMSADEVGSYLRRASIFLSFGHPEGFGLPVAEALATGAYVIGYTGMGARELFHQAGSYGMAYEIEYGDWFSFPTAIQAALTALQYNTVSRDDKERLAYLIRSRYSRNTMLETVRQAVAGLAG